MPKGRSNSWLAVLPSLLLPLVLGLGAYFVLITAIERGVVENEYLTRYVAGHPVSKVTTAMFLVGMVALLLVGSELFDQFRGFRIVSFRPLQKRRRSKSKRLPSANAADGQHAEELQSREERSELSTAEQVNQLEQRLFALPGKTHQSYLWKRLYAGLGYIRQHDSAAGLDDELKYLSDLDADQQHERYSLVRILIWATPMLGFLGTVLGISEALGGIAIGADNNFQSMMSGLRSSLYVAFDTTALALTFSIILMFVQFLANRFENQLLLGVDQRAKGEFNQYFQVDSEREDSVQKTIRQMSSQLLGTTETLVERQCEIWNHSIENAQAAWIESMEAAKTMTGEQIGQALERATDNLAQTVANSIKKADRALERRIGQWQVSLSELAREIAAQQKQVAQQTGAVVDAATQFKEISELQKHLLEYMKTLPESTELLDASDRLTTAIRLLEFRASSRWSEEASPEEKTAQQQRTQSTVDGKIVVPKLSSQGYSQRAA